MKFTPRKTIFLVSQLVIALCSIFSAVNIYFAHSGTPRIMPMGLSMTGFLSKAGIALSESSGQSFFSVYSLVLSGIVCAVLLLSTLLSGLKRGWLAVGSLIVLADCVGIALIILSSGYRTGYWFELAGHAVLLIALIVSFITKPRFDHLSEAANKDDAAEQE